MLKISQSSGQSWVSPKLGSGSCFWVSHADVGAQDIEPLSTAFPGNKQETGLEVKLGLEPAPIKNSDTVGRSWAHYTVMPALKCYFLWKTFSYLNLPLQSKRIFWLVPLGVFASLMRVPGSRPSSAASCSFLLLCTLEGSRWLMTQVLNLSSVGDTQVEFLDFGVSLAQSSHICCGQVEDSFSLSYSAF